MFVLKCRMTGKYLAKLPYADSASRYVRDISSAQTFSRYVDAFNAPARRANEMVIEI